MIEKIENCQEGGEGIVIKPNYPFTLDSDISRCSCLECKAQNCLRLLVYKSEITNPNNNRILVSKFCGDVLTDPKNDCNFYIQA